MNLTKIGELEKTKNYIKIKFNDIRDPTYRKIKLGLKNVNITIETDNGKPKQIKIHRKHQEKLLQTLKNINLYIGNKEQLAIKPQPKLTNQPQTQKPPVKTNLYQPLNMLVRDIHKEGN